MAAARSGSAAAAQTKSSVTAAAAAAEPAGQHHVSDSQNALNANTKAESGQQQLVAEGLSIDSIAAEAAARPAADLPSQYAVKGVIDPQSPQQSGKG